MLLIDAGFDTPLKTPFDVSVNVQGFRTGTPSQIYNATTGIGITQNLTSGEQNNSTIGGTPAILNPIETLLFPLALLWSFIQFFTGAFVFQVLAVFGFPAEFVFAMQGVIGALFARSVVYWVWGR